MENEPTPNVAQSAPVDNTPSAPTGVESEASILEAAMKLIGTDVEVPTEAPNAEEPPQNTAPAQETKPEVVDPVVEGPASRGWAAVKEQEKRLRQEREEFKLQRAELEQMQKKIEEMQKGSFDVLSKLRDDPFSILEKAGVSFEDLANRVLNGDKPGPDEKVKRTTSEVEELRKELASFKAQLETQKAQEFDTRYQNDAASVIKADPKFKLLQSYGKAVEDIYELACLHARQTGQILPAEQAAAMILEEYENDLKSTLLNDAVREKFGIILKENESPVKEKTKPVNVVPSKTVTNQMGSSPTSQPKERPPMSEREELEEAVKLLNLTK